MLLIGSSEVKQGRVSGISMMRELMRGRKVGNPLRYEVFLERAPQFR